MNNNNKCNPNDDINCYFNHQWIDKTDIPNDKNEYSSFTELSDNIEKELINILKNNSNENLSNFYQSLQNPNEELFKTLLQKIDSVKYENILDLLCLLTKHGINHIFKISIIKDIYQENINRLYINSDGFFGLQYYYNDKSIMSTYKIFVKKLIEKVCSNLEINNININHIIDMETMMAVEGISISEENQIETSYYSYTKKELFTNELMCNKFGKKIWLYLFKKLNINHAETIILNYPSMFTLITQLLISIKNNKELFETFKSFLKWNVIIKLTSCNHNYRNIYFEYFIKPLKGIKEMTSLDKFNFNLCERYVGNLISEIYNLSQDKNKCKVVKNMIDLILEATKQTINETKLQYKTKEQAILKLNSLDVCVGKPKKYENYKSIKLSNNDLLNNIFKIEQFFFNKYIIDRIDKPNDSDYWEMQSYEVNAYYNPSTNQIVIPYGIMNKPYFSIDRHPVINFGSLGAIIGHEIIHGFDNEGRKFDYKGIYRDWWTELDSKYYQSNVDKIIKHYNKIIISDIKINSELTIGENIADIGGICMSYKAYYNYLHNDIIHDTYYYELLNPKGFNSKTLTDVNVELKNKDKCYVLRIITQFFFMGWAETWKKIMTKKHLIDLINIDVHSPSPIRINAVLSHVPFFYDTFLIDNKDKMYIKPEERNDFMIFDPNMKQLCSNNDTNKNILHKSLKNILLIHEKQEMLKLNNI